MTTTAAMPIPTLATDDTTVDTTVDTKETVLLERSGAQLVERSFRAHDKLIDAVVAQAGPEFEIEPRIVVYGKECRQPRDVQFRSDVSKGYFYSNQVMASKPLTAEMAELLAVVNEEFGAEYNGVLINRYKNGTKTVGAHADSEDGLDAGAGVVAISHGTQRLFRIRDKQTNRIVGDVRTRHHMALQMRGPGFQQKFTHEIPIEKRITDERISLTFRKHDPATEARLFARTTKKRSRQE